VIEKWASLIFFLQKRKKGKKKDGSIVKFVGKEPKGFIL
jgi:hypothetical protein